MLQLTNATEKSIYEEPEIWLYLLDEEDVITTSGEDDGGGGEAPGGGNDWTGEWDTDF